MIKYLRCNEIKKDTVYDIFKAGFSDYMIKLDMPKEIFFARFFGPEGNKMEYSYIAMDGINPIGLVLGGIRIFDGLKTLRCGTMCVLPEYRGLGISSKLMDLHESVAKENDCDQMFLECLTNNDRAMKFYEKNNYSTVYDLNYYSSDDLDFLQDVTGDCVEEITFDEFKNYRYSLDIHMNWQNEVDYIKDNDSDIYGIKESNKLIAAIVVKNNSIQFIHVNESYRKQGLGRSLIKKSLNDQVGKIGVSFSSSVKVESYFLSLGFKENILSQKEMYKNIK